MNPLSLLTGVWGYVAAAILAAVLSIGGTYYVVHNSDLVVIGSLKLAAAQTQTANVTASLTKLQSFIGQMDVAETNYSATIASINNQFAGINARLANVKTSAPLPVDCKPDTGRLSILTAAVSAANQSTATAK